MEKQNSASRNLGLVGQGCSANNVCVRINLMCAPLRETNHISKEKKRN